jgi:hypothetical protein
MEEVSSNLLDSELDRLHRSYEPGIFIINRIEHLLEKAQSPALCAAYAKALISYSLDTSKFDAALL